MTALKSLHDGPERTVILIARQQGLIPDQCQLADQSHEPVEQLNVDPQRSRLVFVRLKQNREPGAGSPRRLMVAISGRGVQEVVPRRCSAVGRLQRSRSIRWKPEADHQSRLWRVRVRSRPRKTIGAVGSIVLRSSLTNIEMGVLEIPQHVRARRAARRVSDRLVRTHSPRSRDSGKAVSAWIFAAERRQPELLADRFHRHRGAELRLKVNRPLGKAAGQIVRPQDDAWVGNDTASLEAP